MKSTLPVLIALVIAFSIYQVISSQQAKSNAELRDKIEVLDSSIKNLEERLLKIESQPSTTTTPLSPTLAPQVSSISPRPTRPPATASAAQARVVDVPPADGSTCSFATINSDTKLAQSLTWNSMNGGSFIGDLPKGTIVEILTSTLYIWDDYPDEHGLYVRVVEAPSARRIENQTGYIEMRRIGHKRCNLGAEFEK